MTFNQWDILVVPFPFVDSPQHKPRPVLVISNDKFNSANSHCIAAMITTASNTSWHGDTEITDLKVSGLKIKSYIRMKLFTLDSKIEPRSIGKLSKEDIANFKKNFSQATFI